ncbi:putative phage tail protein [Veillonella magna]|uniref:putative phage tail protein n=1 Tax=Veillonella magna TaxID=464322 RepID=UPI0026DDA89D|nr:putative phage tail protein [Veillonella magna]
MIFELLRTHKVDVLRYLPKFLANDGTFKDVQDALSTEHENLRLTIIDIARQFFVETATWGLADWERIYDLPSIGGVAERRAALLRKIRARDTITKSRMQALVDSIVWTHDATIVENVAPGVFRIDMETIIALEELRAAVNFYKPAHLTYVIAHSFLVKGDLYVGGSVSELDIETINPAVDEDINIDTATLYFGGAISVFEISYIGGNNESI